MEVFVFVQDNCPTCQRLKDQLNIFEKENMSKVSYFSPFNAKEHFQKYNVLSTPVTILVNKDQEEIDRFYGAKNSELIKEFIKENKR